MLCQMVCEGFLWTIACCFVFVSLECIAALLLNYFNLLSNVSINNSIILDSLCDNIEVYLSLVLFWRL